LPQILFLGTHPNLWIFFSDTTQIFSIIVSFLSITFSSIKLFYSQRLGRYLDLDPTMKMIVFVALPVILLIAGPLATVVCMATYFKEKVIAYIMIMIALNAIVMKCFWSIPSSSPYKSCETMNIREKYYEKQMKQDQETLLNTAIFTSWICPCSVWFYKSNFLLMSSIMNLLGHITGVASILILISSAELPLSDNPPITHCFKNENNLSLRCILDLFS
jgi:hypothetical protein